MATINDYRRQGFTTISNLLLVYYPRLELTEVEIVLILELESFSQSGNNFPSNKLLASRTNLSSLEVSELIQNLINKGVLQLAQENDSSGRISNYYSLDGLYDKLEKYVQKHVPNFTHSESQLGHRQDTSSNPIQELVRQFELEFGRLLSPIERQEVASWITVDHYDPEVIKLALREAILGQVYNFKYVDRILLNWQRHNLKTVDQVKNFFTKKYIEENKMVEKLLSDDEARQVLYRILQLYPDAKGELHWDTKFHLLCAVLMSAQTTDKMVNAVTPKFNQDFPDSFVLAKADIQEIEADIKTIGLYHTKAKHLKETAEIISDKYNGEIPNNKKELMALPGVGEKTANVVLAEGFGVPAIAVDTHVSRISKKFKIVGPKATPHEISLRLQEILPKKDWVRAHHAMILFGRYTMPARVKDKDPYSFLPTLKKNDIN